MIQKRGQFGANVLIYLFAIIVIAIIIIFGYALIFGTTENLKKTNIVLFKNKLTSDIKSMSSDFGSSKKVPYTIPESAELCLFNLEKKSEILSNLPQEFNLLIQDSLQSNVDNNAFLIGQDLFESFNIGNIEINDPYFKCAKPVSGTLNIIIEGAGSKALVSFGD